jgi:flagellar basal-body rod modification protein FlgD
MTTVGTSTSTNTSTNTSTSTGTSTGTSTLGYDAFLKLLTAQMQYQDPTKPMDSTQFVSQLASFSNVEQSVKMNAKLDAIVTQNALGQADGLIGKTVTSADEKVSGKVVAVRIFSDGAQAVLENGKTVLMEAGVKISETPTEAAAT